MSADTRIVVIKVFPDVFAGVLQATESLLPDEGWSDDDCRRYAAQYIGCAFEAAPDQATLGLVRFSSLEDALAAVPLFEEVWDRDAILEYREPLVVELSAGTVRKMRATGYA